MPLIRLAACVGMSAVAVNECAKHQPVGVAMDCGPELNSCDRAYSLKPVCDGAAARSRAPCKVHPASAFPCLGQLIETDSFHLLPLAKRLPFRWQAFCQWEEMETVCFDQLPKAGECGCGMQSNVRG